MFNKQDLCIGDICISKFGRTYIVAKHVHDGLFLSRDRGFLSLANYRNDLSFKSLKLGVPYNLFDIIKVYRPNPEYLNPFSIRLCCTYSYCLRNIVHSDAINLFEVLLKHSTLVYDSYDYFINLKNLKYL